MECATALAAGCPNCGFQNQPGAKFCSECATPLSTAARPAAATSPPAAAPATNAESGSSAERRLVSVLFADLVGFTPFAEERDSEDVRETLTAYFDLAREVIERYGGTVEKFIGDAVMAVWGAPMAREDDAERAVRAALQLVEAVTSLGPTIQARAGVLTGEAAVTIGATNQGMVAGDIVNTAARLQSVAPPGSVLVGDSTQRATSAAISFEPAGEQLLKGKQAPVAAWRALRVVAERGGRNRSEALEAPFVGRNEEFRLIKDLFHATGREKRLRVVSVIGPAGIGKSRLAREFSIYIDGLMEDVYWHGGRSPAYGEGITFWALGEMVRERAGLAELDDEETTRTKIKETVARWVPDPTERDWIESSLLALLGVEGGMAADQLFGAWRTFFERIAENGPVALVFEDMHFADAGLLDFVDHLLDFSRGLPIYVVTLARPDLIERRADWGAGKRNFVSMYLEPLAPEHMRELLAGLVPGLPQPAVQSIIARADGIPLYAVETIRTLVAEGRLVEEGGVYVPKGDLTTLAVPETLTALIAARLDALEETDRRLVHDAAVLGQSFAVAALSAVADVPEKELEPRLASLVRRELLRREMDARSPERGQYEFVQALIREVAYNTLSKKDRKKLHLAAARYFESLGNDEIAGALASHYLAAHANAGEGAEADALAGQARIALKAAAGRALNLGAFDQAAKFFEQALTVTTDPAEQADMLKQAAEASRSIGHYEHAEDLLRRASDLLRGLGDRPGVVDAEGLLAVILGMEMKLDEQHDRATAVIEEFKDLADLPALDVVRLQLARAVFGRGDSSRALLMIDAVLTSAERRDHLHLITRALILKANCLLDLGRRREGFGVTKLVRDIATENGMIDDVLRSTNNLGGMYSELDVRVSLDLYREALALARRTGHRGALNQLVGNIGYAGFLTGEWDYALSELEPVLASGTEPRDALVLLNNHLLLLAARGESVEEGLNELTRLGKDMSGLQWHLFVADPDANAGLANGDLERAKKSFLEVAESDASQASEYFYRATRPALWSRDLDEARRLSQLAIDAGGYGPIIAARKQAVRAGVAALEGRSAEALALYREALNGWRQTGAVWDEALTGLDMAELLDPADPEIADVLASTRSILERLRAKPYLERLESAAARSTGSAKPTSRKPLKAEVAVAE